VKTADASCFGVDPKAGFSQQASSGRTELNQLGLNAAVSDAR